MTPAINRRALYGFRSWIVATALLAFACAALMASSTQTKAHRAPYHSRTSSRAASRRPVAHHDRNSAGTSHARVRRSPTRSARNYDRSRASLHTARYASHPAQTSAASGPKKPVPHRRRRRYYHHYRRSSRLHYQRAPTPERISQIQSALARSGYYQGEPNGRWDANSVAALEKFQSAHGLDPTGKLDALSLQKMGLGSDIAGVSAPKVVVPHSSASVSPALDSSASADHSAPSAVPAPSVTPAAAPSAAPAPANTVPSASASAPPHAAAQKPAPAQKPSQP